MDKGKKQILYSGRRKAGRSYLVHEWFMTMLPTLKKGWTMAIPTKGGVGVFEFKGIQKPKSKITFKEIDNG